MNRRLRQILILASLGIGFASMYRSTIAAFVAEWMSSPEASYRLILATTAIVVAIRRWPAFRSKHRRAEGRGLAGLGLAAFGALLFSRSARRRPVPDTRVLRRAARRRRVGAGRSRATRAMAAPLAFLLMAIPLPTLVVNEVTLPLQLAASRVAEVALGLMAIPVYRDGNLLTLPSANTAGRGSVQRPAIGGLAWGP